MAILHGYKNLGLDENPALFKVQYPMKNLL